MNCMMDIEETSTSQAISGMDDEASRMQGEDVYSNLESRSCNQKLWGARTRISSALILSLRGQTRKLGAFPTSFTSFIPPPHFIIRLHPFPPLLLSISFHAPSQSYAFCTLSRSLGLSSKDSGDDAPRNFTLAAVLSSIASGMRLPLSNFANRIGCSRLSALFSYRFENPFKIASK
ncbi:hypothetical protein SCHPADRAFT_222568 [Schizopora paradoxa]|uniref:Uncharacterized protein n=1 Tax=Schizopora paradoxa TaxID=27342 RepID=A0A0H2RXF3_9AGAM|nr:hypothetical protein SCHPADRAFT_222568 [Schizopora paradoxa]